MTEIEATLERPATLDVREPATYERGNRQLSYFRDLINAHQGDNAAQARLARHAREINVELERRNKLARDTIGDRLELRTNPNRLAGQGGNFAPPLWLIDEFATAPRTGRVLSHLMPNLELPAGVGTVNIPRITTGTKTVTSVDGAPAGGQDIVDAAVTSAVVAISGQGDVSQQELDQSPVGTHLDYVFFRDLSADYNQTLERQLISGTGTANGQLTGILNLTTGAGAVNAVTYTDAAPTGSAMVPFLGNMAAQTGDARLMPPQMWLMRTARWAWLASSEDTAKAPFPTQSPMWPLPGTFDDDIPTPVAPLFGWPIYCDDAIPATLAATGNQDAIISCRPSDGLLLESVPHFSVITETLSGTLQVRLQLHRYVAALQRYPTGIATLTGTGLVVQSGE